jgi:hypothetical protein
MGKPGDSVQKSVDTDRKIDKLQGLFTSQWGRLVEAMVAPAALALFRQRGIEVVETMQRVVVKRILGSMAYITADEQSERFAASQGLFVIGLTGENLVSIRNPLDFVPRDFGVQGS